MNIISEPTTRAITEIHTHIKQDDGSWLQNKYTADDDVLTALYEYDCFNSSVIDHIMEWQEQGNRIDFFVDGEDNTKIKLLGDFWIDLDGNSHSHYGR